MHGRDALTLTGLLMLAWAGGCSGLTPQAQHQLDLGYQRYSAGDNAGTVREMDAFLQSNSRSSRADEAYYLRGLARYNLRRYDGAKTDLEQAVSDTENPELRGKASLALGDLSYETNDMSLAENMYRHALASLPRGSELLSQGYYRLGRVLQRQGRWREADAQFHKAMYYFPNAEAGRRSGLLINANAWTIQAATATKMISAEAMAKRLRNRGLAARAILVRQDKVTQIAVQVGRYSRYEDAAAVLPKVKAIQKDAFVTVTR